jgi:hypothetical protein
METMRIDVRASPAGRYLRVKSLGSPAADGVILRVTAMFSLGIAYLLWALGGFGTLGLHRFYLRKPGTGVLWLLTGGILWIGAVVDLFRLPRLVDEANLFARHRDELGAPGPTALAPRAQPQVESLEQVILRVAKENGGIVSPGAVATSGNWTLDEAKSYLDGMVDKGHAELRPTKSGTPSVVYVIPDFLTDNTRGQLEEL